MTPLRTKTNMSDPIPNIDPPVPAAPAAPTETVDWQARYNGLNKHYQEKHAEWQAKFNDANAAATSATSQATELTGRLSQLDTQLKEKETALGQISTEFQTTAQKAATLQADLDRKNLLIKDYPDLLGHEAQGLIRPDLTGDELRAHLDAHRNTLNSTHNNALQNQIRGLVPSPANAVPAGGGMADAETIFEKMNEALAAKNWKLHEQLSDQYIQLKSTQK